jgi:hypothetical protein|tara:strand:+ start:77 stop:478 length:402 start_codon:yes stop_codon:yes gene_type:complete
MKKVFNLFILIAICIFGTALVESNSRYCTPLKEKYNLYCSGNDLIELHHTGVALTIIGGITALIYFISLVRRFFRSESGKNFIRTIRNGGSVRNHKKQRQAADDLLRYKKLFDEGILNESEYKQKVIELKKKL